MKKIYFITGIGTDVGKTIVSAIITEALKADYWKPIQAGSLDFTDTDFVKSLVTAPNLKFHHEAYTLTRPESPHAASKKQNINIKLIDFKIPNTQNTLIIEGAGGLLVPINEKETMLDLIKYLNAEVILVSKNYLGSINHTLLTHEVLKTHKIPVKGIVFNGETNKESEDIILSKTNYPVLLRIYQESDVNKAIVKKYADYVYI